MNVKLKEKIQMTPEEYFKFEETSEIKHEYFDGEVFAMTGASLNHNQINANIMRELGIQLKHSPCRPLSSDMRVKVEEIEKYTYPDIAVVCAEINLEETNGLDTLLNPIVLMEILSESTEAYDRGKKFTHYRLIPSLREYVLVSQSYCNVERFVRCERGIWQILPPITDMEQSVSIESINCELLLSDIYYRVDFEGKHGVTA